MKSPINMLSCVYKLFLPDLACLSAKAMFLVGEKFSIVFNIEAKFLQKAHPLSTPFHKLAMIFGILDKVLLYPFAMKLTVNKTAFIFHLSATLNQYTLAMVATLVEVAKVCSAFAALQVAAPVPLAALEIADIVPGEGVISSSSLAFMRVKDF